jgi:hypothetical protein
MSQRLAGTYSADRVQVSIGLAAILGQAVDVGLPNGLSIPHVIDGYGTDAFLTVAREVATNSKTTGSDGEVIVQESRNASGMFGITLMQSSVSNTVLSSMLTLWESGVKFMFPMVVIDLDSFGTLYEADECWIQGWPEAGFGATLGTLTWNIEAARLRMFHGSRGLVG